MKLFFVVMVSMMWVSSDEAVAEDLTETVVKRVEPQRKVKSEAMQKGKKTRPTMQKKTVELDKIGPFRYILGSIIGSTLGFGIGHMVQKRWRDDYGWAFTVAEVATLVSWNVAESEFNCYKFGNRVTGSRAREHLNFSRRECESRKERRARPWAISFFTLKALEAVWVWWPRNISWFASTEQRPVQANLTDITTDDFVLGGILGTFVGFGSGHAVQGRWRQDGGMFYTFSQLAGLTLLGYGSYCNTHPSKCLDEWAITTGWFLLLTSKVSEFFGVWSASASRYRLVANKSKLPFSIMPVLDGRQAGLQLALAF